MFPPFRSANASPCRTGQLHTVSGYDFPLITIVRPVGVQVAAAHNAKSPLHIVSCGSARAPNDAKHATSTKIDFHIEKAP